MLLELQSIFLVIACLSCGPHSILVHQGAANVNQNDDNAPLKGKRSAVEEDKVDEEDADEDEIGEDKMPEMPEPEDGDDASKADEAANPGRRLLGLN